VSPDVRRRKIQLLWSGNTYGVGDGSKASRVLSSEGVEGEAFENVIVKNKY